MPINLFSKIKIRRGLAQDLPDLSESELGFATDTGQVFIGAPEFPPLEDKGRGEIDEEFPYKNIELLTNSPSVTLDLKYTYDGNTGVNVQTGPTGSEPVVRFLQERMNDFVTSPAFDVLPNGNDVSIQFNRMLREIYNYNSEQDRKKILIPSGLYLFEDETIGLPPYTYIEGEGKDSTILRYEGSDNYFFETIDSDFQSDLAIGTNDADLPVHIFIKNMTIEVDSLVDIMRLNRASHIQFENVKIVGAWETGSTGSDAIVLDKIGDVIEIKDIRFINCDFINVGNVLIEDNVGNDVSEVLFENCVFDGGYNAFIFDESDSNGYKITNSVFKNFENRILRCNRGKNLKLLNNIYNDSSNILSNEAINISISFINFSSISDSFIDISDTIINESNTSIIKSHDEDNHVFNDVEYSKQFEVVLNDNVTDDNFGIQFELDRYSAVFLEYTLKRDTEFRIGRIRIMNDGANIFTSTEFSESGSTGITFDGEIINVGGTDYFRPTYSTTNTGDDANMTFTYMAWLK